MIGNVATTELQPINRGYDSVFRVKRLSVGLVVPIENYAKTSAPQMDRQF